MTASDLRELITTTAAVVLSLLFSYIPTLNDRWATVDPTKKRLTMLLMVGLTTGGIFAVVCFNLIPIPNLACDRATATQLLRAFILAAIANQTTFQLSPQRAAYKLTQARNNAKG